MSDQTPVPPPPPPPPAPSDTAAAPAPAGPPPPPPPPEAPVAPVAAGAAGDGRGGSGRGRRTAIIGGVAAALVLGGGFGAYAVYDRLSGGGAQPHDVMPASTDVYFRVDLDPSASQKVDLFKLLRKVPDLAEEAGITSDTADIRKLVFPEILSSACDDVDYEKDVEPWLGDRIGVGGDIDDRTAVIAVQTTDEDKSRAGIKALFDCADEDYGVTYLDGYALISPTQKEADKAAAGAEKSSLGDSKKFTADFDQLGNQGIATGWADLSAFAELPEAKEALGPQVDDLAKAGTVAVALRADGDAIELAALGQDGVVGQGKGDTKATPLSKLPADTVAALSIAGVGDQVEEGFDAFIKEFDQQFSGLDDSAVPGVADDAGAADPIGVTVSPSPTVPTLPTPTELPSIPTPSPSLDDPFGDDLGEGTEPFDSDPFSGGGFDVEQFLAEIERETGFTLPDDLATLFGDSVTLTIGAKNLETIPTLSGPEGFSELDVALALESEQAPALDLVRRIAAQASKAGIPLVASPTDDGAVLATNQGAADAISDPKGSLGDEKAFTSVIPDGDDAYGGLFVNIGAVLDKLLEADPPDDVRKDIESASALSAFGFSVAPQDDGRALARLRLSFK